MDDLDLDDPTIGMTDDDIFRSGQQSVIDMLREADEEFWKLFEEVYPADNPKWFEGMRSYFEKELKALASAIQEKIEKERGS